MMILNRVITLPNKKVSSLTLPPPEPPHFQTSPFPHLSSLYSPQNTSYSSRTNKLFDILKFDPASSIRRINVAYSHLARHYHTNKWDNKGFSLETSIEKFKKISNTYDDLKLFNILF